MARPAPAIDRTIAVLNFLAAHPDEAFTLSELARRLDINKATAHAMLAALTDAGYLLRDPRRRRHARARARRARERGGGRQFEVVDYARDEMRRLSDDLGVECVASAAIGDEIVILARSGDPRPLGISVQVGPAAARSSRRSAPCSSRGPAPRRSTAGCATSARRGDEQLERYRRAVAAVRAPRLLGRARRGAHCRPARARYATRPCRWWRRCRTRSTSCSSSSARRRTG